MVKTVKEIIKTTALDETVGYIDVAPGRDFTIYVEATTGTTAGTVRIEEAPFKGFVGTWATVQDVSTTAAGIYAVHFSGVFGAMRVRLETAITGGTVRVYVVDGHNEE